MSGIRTTMSDREWECYFYITKSVRVYNLRVVIIKHIYDFRNSAFDKMQAIDSKPNVEIGPSLNRFWDL